MIIAFCGNRGVGKDTAGAYLIKQYGFERRAFADPLKKSIAAFLNIPFWEVDKHKLDETVYVTVGYKNKPSPPPVDTDRSEAYISLAIPTNMWSPISEQSFREALQRYGTESHRDIFGQNFWVDLTLPVEGFYSGRKISITDLRFQNEIDRVHEIGGIVCHIKRPAVINKDPHSSEAVDLLNNIDYEIMNNTTVEDFLSEVDLMLHRIGERND